uniref:Proteasomal ATPase second OB domain-containing protein n=1 Tax=Glossina austeni TaxID=7395 RepID=A0A1A9UCP8_GLOAU
MSAAMNETDYEETLLQKLLEHVHLGNKKPSAFSREIRQLFYGKVSDDLLKLVWFQGLPTTKEVVRMSTDGIVSSTRLMDSEIKIMKSEVMRISHEIQAQNEKIRDNAEKIKVNKTLPYLVSNVVQRLDMEAPEDEDDGAVLKANTSTHRAYFLPVIGLVDAEKLKPGDLVGVNKDSYLILETLPAEYDARVKAMGVDERPTEQYSDIGGLDKQIQELIEVNSSIPDRTKLLNELIKRKKRRQDLIS